MERFIDKATGKPRNERFGTGESLCCYCANACTNGCSWAEEFVPVEGWEAVQNKNGFFVIDCPKFRKESRARRNPDSLDTDGCLNLMEAMFRMLRHDYVKSPKMRASIERFIRNPNSRGFFFFSEPEEIIKKLRIEAGDKK